MQKDKTQREWTDCPVQNALMIVGNKWDVLIVLNLLDGKKRFGALRDSIGKITQKVLTSNLRELESDGIVKRTVFKEVPPHVEYELTQFGFSLKPAIDALAIWGEQYAEAHK